jgi:hypothetical protein
METVKVDIQKLQLLNDRIAQTIEALNQVRMSAHGIQHTVSPFGYGAPYAGFAPQLGVPQQLGFAPQFGAYPTPYPGTPYPGMQSAVPYGVPFGGVQHVSPLMPYTSNGISHTPAQTWPQPWQLQTWQTLQGRTTPTWPFVQTTPPTTTL